MKRRLTLALALLTSTLWAGNPPMAIPFSEGEQFELSLSRLNFNRIFVEGEKIVQLNFPEGAFTVDKSELANPDSKEGSVYLKPMVNTRLTVFFATDAGHHFSFTITPDEESGKTIRLLTKVSHPPLAQLAPERKIDEFDAIVASLMAGETPAGFKNITPRTRPFYVQKQLKLSLIKAYRGKGVAGYVYLIENKAKTNIALTPGLFKTPTARRLKLSADSIAPQQTAYLFGVFDEREAHHA